MRNAWPCIDELSPDELRALTLLRVQRAEGKRSLWSRVTSHQRRNRRSRDRAVLVFPQHFGDLFELLSQLPRWPSKNWRTRLYGVARLLGRDARRMPVVVMSLHLVMQFVRFTR